VRDKQRTGVDFAVIRNDACYDRIVRNHRVNGGAFQQ
jgi:hypothetical protein